MANEATIITLLGNSGDPVEYTVATGTAIPKGSIMVMDSSPQTAKISAADGNFFVGIAAYEKTATDGVTKMACITHCIAECKYSASGTLGQPQKVSGVNTIADADEAGAKGSSEVVGMGLETATTGTGAVWIGK